MGFWGFGEGLGLPVLSRDFGNALSLGFAGVTGLNRRFRVQGFKGFRVYRVYNVFTALPVLCRELCCPLNALHTYTMPATLMWGESGSKSLKSLIKLVRFGGSAPRDSHSSGLSPKPTSP